MKKIVMTAALTAFAAVVTAQTVTSANIVGYNKAANVPGLQIFSVQFDTGDNTPEGIFGDTLPEGSKVYKYDPVAGYIGNVATYEAVLFGGVAWNKTLDLNQSGSFWVETSAAVTSIIAGEVYAQAAVTNDIVPGLQLMSFPYPVQTSVSQLNITPTEGDKIYKYDIVNGYIGNVATYEAILFGGIGWNKELTFEVGEGFWYESAAVGTVQWIEVKPF